MVADLPILPLIDMMSGAKVACSIEGVVQSSLHDRPQKERGCDVPHLIVSNGWKATRFACKRMFNAERVATSTVGGRTLKWPALPKREIIPESRLMKSEPIFVTHNNSSIGSAVSHVEVYPSLGTAASIVGE